MNTTEQTLNPGEWETMSPDQLIGQKSIMLDRYEFLASKGYQQQSQMILEGIAKLDSLILNR